MDKLQELYDEMLNLHIGTKTNDIVFHQASAGFYESLFSAFHDSAEAMQDSKQASPMDCATARKRSYEILEEAKSILESMVNSNKDIAVDNVLRGLVDKLGFDCGTARGFANGKEKPVKEGPAEEEETEEAPMPAAESNEEEAMEEDMKDEAESTEEVEEDLVGESMKGQSSGYKTSTKEDKPASKEDDLNKKRKGSTEYTVVSIMPE